MISANGAAPVAHDLETLVGPLLQLFTRLARHGDASLAQEVRSQLLALAQRGDATVDLRLAAGAIVLDPGSFGDDAR